jgi:hypothetical protein
MSENNISLFWMLWMKCSRFWCVVEIMKNYFHLLQILSFLHVFFLYDEKKKKRMKNSLHLFFSSPFLSLTYILLFLFLIFVKFFSRLFTHTINQYIRKMRRSFPLKVQRKNFPDRVDRKKKEKSFEWKIYQSVGAWVQVTSCSGIIEKYCGKLKILCCLGYYREVEEKKFHNFLSFFFKEKWVKSS